MSLRALQQFAITRRLLWRAAAGRARDTAGHVTPYLRPGEAILDVGSGICDITLLLGQAGYAVTPLDVQDISCTPLVRPMLYDGRTMPFKNKQFDTALLLTVLHHIPRTNQAQVLREASRVARQIIIIEDIYTGPLHKYATFFVDSLLNLEFFGHPHSNQTDRQWRATFKRLGFTLRTMQAMHSFGVLRHRLYVLQAPQGRRTPGHRGGPGAAPKGSRHFITRPK